MTRARPEGSGVRIHFAEGEAGILGGLAEQLAEIVDDENDPARARMLPSAYPDDAEADAEFRRWTTADLVERKSAAARNMAARLGIGVTDRAASGDAVAGHVAAAGVSLESEPTSVLLDVDEADGWARTLTDLRTALASRLGIESDDDDIPNSTPGAVYEWLGQLQWTLIESLDELDGIAPTDVALPEGIEPDDDDEGDGDEAGDDDFDHDPRGGAPR